MQAQFIKIIDSPRSRWMFALLWTIITSVYLVQPEANPVLPTGITPAPFSIERELLFSTLHLITFAVMTALWFRVWIMHYTISGALIRAAIIALIIGAITEYLQSYAPDRTPSWADFLTNCAGIIITTLIIRINRLQIQRDQSEISAYRSHH